MANTKIPSELVAINAISGTLIADNAITSVHIAENNITATQIAINAVTALQMADGTITSAKIADGTIVTADIADGQITTGKIADSSVTTGKIAAGTILGGDIANNAILTQHIDDNQITADQIADNAVGLDQMAGLTRGSIVYGNAAGNPAYLAAGTNGHVLTSDGTDISWTADTDLFLASSGGTVSGTLTVDAGSSGMIDFGDVTSAYGRLYADSSGTYIGSKSNHNLILRSNHVAALTLDTSQNATFAGTISSGAITSTSDITTNSTTHAYMVINSSATNRASWLWHKQGGTARWLSGVEGSESDWQLYSTNSGNTGTRLRVTADGNATFAGTVTVAQNILSTSGAPLVLSAAGGGSNIELYANGTAFIDATSTSFRGTNGSGTGNISAGTISGTLSYVGSGSFPVTPNTNANDLVVFGTGSHGISILSGTGGDGNIFFGDSGGDVRAKIQYSHNGDYMTIMSPGAYNILAGGDMTVDAAGDINLDADGGDIQLKDAGVATGRLGLENGDLNIASTRSNYDIVFKGNDSDTGIITAMKLDMSDAGTAHFENNVYINSSLYIGDDVRLSSDSNGELGVGYGQTATNNRFTVYNNTSIGLRVDPASRVGINQDPSANNFTLQVKGIQTDGTDGRVAYFKGYGTATAIGSTGPTVAIQNANNTANNFTKLSFESAGAGETVSINSHNRDHSNHYGDMAFNTRGSGGYSEKMRIMANGNVGIGTDNPQAKLNISGSSENIRLDNTGTSNYGLEIWRGGSKGASFAWGEGNANLEIKNYRNDSQSAGPYANIDFFTGGTDADSPDYNPTRRMRIQQTGEVGIGIDNPLAPLNIQSDSGANGIRIAARSGNDHGFISFYANNNTDIWSEISGSAGTLRFYTGSTLQRMRIDSTGKVNIGITTTVDDCLAIGNTSRDTAVTMSKASGGAVTREIIRFNGPLRLGVATGGHHTYIYGGGTSYLEVEDSGRVLAKNTTTAAGPVYTFQSDDNTGMYSPAADTIELSTGGVRGLSVQPDSSILVGATLASVNATQKSGKIAGKATPNVMEWDLPRSNTSYQHGDSISGFNSAYGLSYGLNGDANANKWKLGEGPSGCTEWLWAGISAGSTGGSGGWGTGNISIDNNYSYLFVLWVKRVSSASSGTYYHGTGGVHDTSGNSLSNPYMTISGTGGLPQNVWCVDIQPIHAWHMTSNVAMGNQGLFRTDTGARIQQHSGQFSGVNIYRAGTSSNQSHNIGHRTYLYYPTANDGTELHWACPRLYRIDGSQPSAAELISGEMNAASAGMS